MVIISGYAISNGNLDNLAKKFDMDRTNCTEEYPKKLFTRLIPDPTKLDDLSLDE